VRIPEKDEESSEEANLAARFKHWLERRARCTPPKTADFGEPTSSRLRHETGNDWRIWSSMSFMMCLIFGI
jgi:hypothetical protein